MDEEEIQRGDIINQLLADCGSPVIIDVDAATNGDSTQENEREEEMPIEIHYQEDDTIEASFADFEIENDNENNIDNENDKTHNKKNGNPCVPKLSQWKEDDLLEDNFEVTFARAHRRLWNKGKQELKNIKKNISNLQIPGIDETRGDIYSLYQFLFGSKSLLHDVMCRHLTGLTTADYLQFMLTFVMSCKNQTSLQMMHFCKFTDTKDLMTHDTYNLLWARIATLGGTLRKQPFWMTIEDLANDYFKSLFMNDDPNSQNNYLIGLDDDKLHFHYSRNSTMNGLKCVHHVKDNRRGFTLHTAAFSALCVPVCVMYQREMEGVQATYMRMMKSLFGKERGEAAPDLRGVILASDRGYWKPGLLFDDILEAGANVEGTIQRVRIFVSILCWLIIVYSHLFLSFFKFHSRTGSPLHQKNQAKNSLPSQKILTSLDIGTPFPTKPFGKGRMSISKSMHWHIGAAPAGLLPFHFRRLILAVIGIWFRPTIIMKNGTFQKTCLLKRSK